MGLFGGFRAKLQLKNPKNKKVKKTEETTSDVTLFKFKFTSEFDIPQTFYSTAILPRTSTDEEVLVQNGQATSIETKPETNNLNKTTIVGTTKTTKKETTAASTKTETSNGIIKQREEPRKQNEHVYEYIASYESNPSFVFKSKSEELENNFEKPKTEQKKEDSPKLEFKERPKARNGKGLKLSIAPSLSFDEEIDKPLKETYSVKLEETVEKIENTKVPASAESKSKKTQKVKVASKIKSEKKSVKVENPEKSKEKKPKFAFVRIPKSEKKSELALKEKAKLKLEEPESVMKEQDSNITFAITSKSEEPEKGVRWKDADEIIYDNNSVHKQQDYSKHASSIFFDDDEEDYAAPEAEEQNDYFNSTHYLHEDNLSQGSSASA